MENVPVYMTIISGGQRRKADDTEHFVIETLAWSGNWTSCDARNTAKFPKLIRTEN